MATVDTRPRFQGEQRSSLRSSCSKSRMPSPDTIRVDAPPDLGQKAAFSILTAISVCHLLNDMVQSLVPAIYPLLKTSFHLDFGQIGLITLTYQLTASL